MRNEHYLVGAQTVFCRMTGLQKDLYSHFSSSAPVQAALGKSITQKGQPLCKLTVLPAIAALKKLCCHPDLVGGPSGIHLERPGAKNSSRPKTMVP
jgi:SNF2 family DNA or RNA helicase